MRGALPVGVPSIRVGGTTYRMPGNSISCATLASVVREAKRCSTTGLTCAQFAFSGQELSPDGCCADVRNCGKCSPHAARQCLSVGRATVAVGGFDFADDDPVAVVPALHLAFGFAVLRESGELRD